MIDFEHFLGQFNAIYAQQQCAPCMLRTIMVRYCSAEADFDFIYVVDVVAGRIDLFYQWSRIT